MKKLLLTVLAFFMMTAVCLAVNQTRIEKLIETVKNHPDAVQMGPDWWRIVDKENISGTEYDWRFDMRRIDVGSSGISIGHRLEQNSGNSPDSNWVIEYKFMDKFADGSLEYYVKQRFISINDRGTWLRQVPSWPDGFKYDDLLTGDEAFDLYLEELNWWENKLK